MCQTELLHIFQRFSDMKTNFGRSNIHYCSLETHKLHLFPSGLIRTCTLTPGNCLKAINHNFFLPTLCAIRTGSYMNGGVAVKGRDHSESAQYKAKKCKWKIRADPCVLSYLFSISEGPYTSCRPLHMRQLE